MVLKNLLNLTKRIERQPIHRVEVALADETKNLTKRIERMMYNIECFAPGTKNLTKRIESILGTLEEEKAPYQFPNLTKRIESGTSFPPAFSIRGLKNLTKRIERMRKQHHIAQSSGLESHKEN